MHNTQEKQAQIAKVKKMYIEMRKKMAQSYLCWQEEDDEIWDSTRSMAGAAGKHKSYDSRKPTKLREDT